MQLHIIRGVLIGLLAGPLSIGQIGSDTQNWAGVPVSGFRIQSVSVFGTYNSGPAGAGQVSTGTLVGGSSTGTSATFSYDRVSERTTVAATYTPTFVIQFENSERIQNHALSLGVRRNISPKWTLVVGASAVASRITEALFLPTPASSAPATFNQYPDAVLPLTTTSSTFFYGNRMLNAGVQSSITYSHSTRLTFHATLSGSRLEALPDSGQRSYAYRAVLTDTTAVAFGSGFSYSLSPRTQVSADWSSSRTISNLEDFYTHTADVSVRRSMSPKWFLNLHGGGGYVQPVRESYSLGGPRYQVGAGLGYKSHAHTFVASCDRSVSNTYGFGAGSSISTSGAWNWNRPGSAWSLSANFGQQWLPTTAFGNVSVWRAGAGATRIVGRHTVVTTQYAFLSESPVSGRAYLPGAQHVLQIAVGWLPANRPTRF